MRHLRLFEQSGENHPAIAATEKFLDQFPNDATSWTEATDEVRDLARLARETHTEIDFDGLHDEWETNPDMPQPLDFRELKTPSEWNTKGKEYIMNTLKKMGDQALDLFYRELKDYGWA